ncbi:MAG: ROK family protein [Micromonosporaceae bacterium]
MNDQPAEQADVRRGNLSLVLRRIRDAGPRSRARIAAETGLTRATVSSLVADLVTRGLLHEGELRPTGGSGRPGQWYELSDRVYGVGAEISVDYLSVIVLDLSGAVRVNQRRAYDVPRSTPAQTLDAVGALVADAVGAVGGWPSGLGVATPGNVDAGSGRVEYAPTIGWSGVPVVTELTTRLGEQAGPVEVGNDVQLSAIAEYALGVAAGTPHLAYLSGEMGVGAGVVVEQGRLLRGAQGHSGEIGHLPLNPEPAACPCGRRGCWETMVGLGALLRLAADPGDPVHDPERDLEDRLAELHRRAAAGDARTLAALDQIATGLGLGASVLVNMVNPAVLVLGGYFAALGQYLLPGVRRELADRVVAPDAAACRVELSHLGFTAAALGGAYAALQRVLADPTRVPPLGLTRARGPST